MSSAFEGLPKTPNLKLNKPGYDNVADIEALNENADILDAEIQGIKNTFVKSVNGINAGDNGNVDLGIIPIAQGGTGATTAKDARFNLGFGGMISTADDMDNAPVNTISGVHGFNYTDSKGETFDNTNYDSVLATLGCENEPSYELNQILFYNGNIFNRVKDAKSGNWSQFYPTMKNAQSAYYSNKKATNTGSYNDITITFPYPFDNIPKVIVNLASNSGAYQNYSVCNFSINAITKTSFTIRMFLSASASYAITPNFLWLAWE